MLIIIAHVITVNLDISLLSVNSCSAFFHPYPYNICNANIRIVAALQKHADTLSALFAKGATTDDKDVPSYYKEVSKAVEEFKATAASAKDMMPKAAGKGKSSSASSAWSDFSFTF